jgi:Ca-activated chloride channel family protein
MRVSVFRAIQLGALIAVLAVPYGAGSAAAGPQQPQQPQKPQEKPQEAQQPDEFAIAVEVPLVNVDVVVVDRNGNFVTGLQRDHFRVTVNGVPQRITNFSPTDAPITMVMLLEFSRLYGGWFAANATYWGYDFLNNLAAQDWVALVSYDLRTRIEVDFTRNKQEVAQHIARMYFPGFSEANLYDAVLETVERLQDVKGKKSILILASGYDTFSKNTLDDALKRLRQTDITIFSVGVARALMQRADDLGYLGGSARVGYYQAENQLRAFAEMTGGRAWFPRFEGELPSIFRNIAAMLRNQYSIGFAPSDRFRDGKFYKIKVELVGPDGKPLVVKDQNDKVVRYQIYAREGFVAPKTVAAD